MIEIIIAVIKLIWIEFFTTVKKDFSFLLPIAYPTIPSVEKAYASKKKEAKIMLIEPKDVLNTGDVINDLTAQNDQWDLAC